jgi:hypothetical protein
VTIDAMLYLPNCNGIWVTWTIKRMSTGVEIREKYATREWLTTIPSDVVSSLILLDSVPMLPSAQTVVQTDDGIWTQWSAEQTDDGVWLQEGRNTPEQTERRTFLPARVVATLLFVWSEVHDN